MLPFQDIIENLKGVGVIQMDVNIGTDNGNKFQLNGLKSFQVPAKFMLRQVVCKAPR
jgi:hypothetical protein